MRFNFKAFALEHLSPASKKKFVRLTVWPPVGFVRLGSLRRTKPISRNWGFDRGRPIDRYYIENFLQESSDDIKGNVLEIGDNTYTKAFGGNKIIKSDVLHVQQNNPGVTIIGDLSNSVHIPSDMFDCFILTQTLQLIYDLDSAVETIYRILKPGGVLLATVPGISKISRYDMDHWGYYWSFTSGSIKKLFANYFGEENLTIDSYGNVLAASAFLYGLADKEISKSKLDYKDPDYEVIITLKAMKRI